MKKCCFVFCLSIFILLSSCAMEATIPENQESFTVFLENRELFSDCVEEIMAMDNDCLISRTDFYAPAGSEDFVGLYLQNLEDSSFQAYESLKIKHLMENCGVKLISTKHDAGLFICAFDMCTPGKNFDYGFYYVSEDNPIYLGDPSISLVESENGYVYSQKADYGTKFSFYTEKVADHYYYYEIT